MECLECNDTGYIEGCGDCETPCTNEGKVICERLCWNCSGGYKYSTYEETRGWYEQTY